MIVSEISRKMSFVSDHAIALLQLFGQALPA